MTGRKKAPIPPRPTPPEKPDPADCCRGGCEPCIFELYADEVHRYRAALAQWESQYGKAGGRVGGKVSAA